MKRKDKDRGLPDFWLTVAHSAKPDHGEDSWCRCFSRDAGLLAVFDGCGGLGAQRHGEYSNETEAFVASRLCAGAFYDAFQALFPGGDPTGEVFCQKAGRYCYLVLSTYRPQDSAQVLGTMVKTLPTTAAAALVLRGERDVTLCPIWAGDSRVYLLTAQGLAQLTEDDATISDPMANLYEDGVLRNVLSAGKAPQLHRRQVNVSGPFLAFSATDGCFGYFSTPMEFEGALLESLEHAAGVAQWESELAERIAPVAGDDFTLTLAAYGFGSFPALKRALAPRLELLRRDYLEPLRGMRPGDRAAREPLWSSYRSNYLRYMKDDR